MQRGSRMREIRIHGRGGQGSLVLAQFMAIAALEDGKCGQAFPFLGGGGERRGKPIMAFCRLADRPIRMRSRVSQPDYVIVQDATVMREVNVTDGLKDGGSILINTDKKLEEIGLGGKPYNVYTVSTEQFAQDIHVRPIANTALLGAFAAVTEELTLEAILTAVRVRFPGEVGEKNAQIAQESFEQYVRKV
jgi:pyruvate ferredoxin oxidoreductase gamma subunit